MLAGALIAFVGIAVMEAQAAVTNGPLNKIWTVALSQYNQGFETGNSVTQLANGTIVVGGNDGNIANYCSTRRNPLVGGAWLVAVSPNLGAFQATLSGANSGLAFGGVNIKGKVTSVTPTTIYP